MATQKQPWGKAWRVYGAESLVAFGDHSLILFDESCMALKKELTPTRKDSGEGVRSAGEGKGAYHVGSEGPLATPGNSDGAWPIRSRNPALTPD